MRQKPRYAAGDLLKDAMANGWTVGMIASRLKVHRATIYRWVEQYDPPITAEQHEQLFKLAEVEP